MRRRLAAAIVLTLVGLTVSAQSAVILELQGSVRVTKAGGGSPHPALPGERLEPGDVLATGADGRAVVMDQDGSKAVLPANATMTVARRPQAAGPLGRLWNAIISKLAGTQETSAQAGRVGALRAGQEGVCRNDPQGETERGELQAMLDSIAAQGYPAEAADLMRAMAYEQFGQYAAAEELYLKRIDHLPADPLAYDLLFDMYLAVDLYAHAAAIRDRKAAQTAGGR